MRGEVRDDVVTALRERDAAAVLVTHDRDEALALGDRAAVMAAGRILQTGRPDEVYERPVDRFVAGFLGEVSFLPDPSTEGSGNDPTTVLMARPGDLGLSVGGDDTVLSRRYVGAAWRFEVRRADRTVVRVDMPAGPGAELLEVGAACTVSVAATHPLHRVPRLSFSCGR